MNQVRKHGEIPGKKAIMIEITNMPISPEAIVNKTKSDDSGCVVTYIGLIRSHSNGRFVMAVEYSDLDGKAADILNEIAGKAKEKWQLKNVAISHRIGRLRVGDINLVIAVASAHRSEGFAACQYIIDQFKQRLPTNKIETYY